MTAAGFRKLLTRVAECSSISFPIHPHMLRHACGYKLVNDGHDVRMIQQYLGHKNIQRRTLFVPCFQRGQIKDLCPLHNAFG